MRGYPKDCPHKGQVARLSGVDQQDREVLLCLCQLSEDYTGQSPLRSKQVSHAHPGVPL